MLDLAEIPSNYGNEKAIVKLHVQDVSACSPQWINVITTNIEKREGPVLKCDMDADFSVSDGVCFWSCPCDGNCTVVLAQNPETITWNLCELRVFQSTSPCVCCL